MMDAASLCSEEEQRRLIVDAAENALLVVDGTGTIVLANLQAERIFGYSPGALCGQPAVILECAPIRARDVPGFESGPHLDPLGISVFGGEVTARHAGGSTIGIEVASRCMNTRDGQLVLFSIAKSIERRDDCAWAKPETPRPATESLSPQMREAQGRIGRWHFDLLSNELTWSDEIYRIYGFPTTEPATVDRAIAGYDPVDRDRIAALVDRAIADGTAYRDEACIIRPDGSTRAVVHGGNAERSADGSIVALSGFFQDVTEHKNAERERERLSDYVTLANQAGKIGIWELDLRTNLSVWDSNVYALYGIDDHTTVPTFELWSATLHPHDRARAVREIKGDLAGGAPSDSEFRVIWQNGEIHTIRSLATLVRDATGAPARIIGTDWDVTEIRSLAEQLREEKDALISSEARYRALTEALPQMVWVLDANGRFEYVNYRWSDYTGLSLDGSRSIGLGGVLDGADAATLMAQGDDSPAHDSQCELRLRRSDGTYRWHLVRSVPFRDATGDAGKWIITATDIEERKAAEKTLAVTVAELEHRAHHDPMTDLPNRKLLMDRLTLAISGANRAHGGVVVLYVDLDRFKAINDTLGHAAGDIVLKETGMRIVAMLRAGDTASRVGGDEFIVVCATSGRGDDVAQIGSRIIAAVTAPIDVFGERITVEASIGISVYPADGFDAETLIRKADAAMYSAKQNGRNAFCRYSSDVQTSIVAATQLEAELRHAIAAGELVVHYQPIIDLRTGRPGAAEALVRWQHPQRGLLPPSEFIAFAEERGLIAQIGDVVLETACAMLQRLQASPHKDVQISVNVSADQFAKAGFVAGVVAALDRHETDPRRLTVEITESVVMGNTRATIATLDELKKIGVNLSIDDFGTGYSSLAYIKNFPIGTLKIDRSFVCDIAQDVTDQAIAKTIITLAHSLDMRVVAEGVETAAQLEILRSFHVDTIQGYFYSRPLCAQEFERYLETFPPPDRTGKSDGIEGAGEFAPLRVSREQLADGTA